MSTIRLAPVLRFALCLRDIDRREVSTLLIKACDRDRQVMKCPSYWAQHNYLFFYHAGVKTLRKGKGRLEKSVEQG